jgi:hypothetical protein
MDYVEDVVLKSAKLPVKACYTIEEVCRMFACSRTTFYRMVHDGTFVISPKKRIYLQDLKIFFAETASLREFSCANKVLNT